MKPIAKYIVHQLDVFRQECNFSDEELEFFNLCAKKKTIVEICQEMNISRTKYYTLKDDVYDKMKEVNKVYETQKPI